MCPLKIVYVIIKHYSVDGYVDIYRLFQIVIVLCLINLYFSRVASEVVLA